MSKIFTTKAGKKHNYTTGRVFRVRNDNNEIIEEYYTIKYQATATDEYDDNKFGGVLRRKFIVDVPTIDILEVRQSFIENGINTIWLSA